MVFVLKSTKTLKGPLKTEVLAQVSLQPLGAVLTEPDEHCFSCFICLAGFWVRSQGKCRALLVENV